MSNKKLSQEDIEARLEGVPETTLEGRVPVSEGVVDGGIDNPTLEDLNKLPPLKRVELSDSLHSLSNDFVFFNHTALFSKGGLDFDPLKEYQIWADKQDLVSYVIFNRSIFSGLDYPDNSGGHDRMLSFVPIEHWHVIEKAIGKFTILNRAKGHMFLCEMVKVRIPDPKQPSLTIEPYLWKMNGSSHSWGYKGFPVPKLVKLPASYEAKYLMKVVNNEPPN